MQWYAGNKRVESAQQNIPLKLILQVVCVFVFNLFCQHGLWLVSYFGIHDPESYSYANFLQMTSDIIKVYCLLDLVDLDPNEDWSYSSCINDWISHLIY